MVTATRCFAEYASNTKLHQHHKHSFLFFQFFFWFYPKPSTMGEFLYDFASRSTAVDGTTAATKVHPPQSMSNTYIQHATSSMLAAFMHPVFMHPVH